MIRQIDEHFFDDVDKNAKFDENDNEIGPIDFKKPRILLEQLNALKGVLSIEEIKHEIHTFFAAV